MPTLRGLRRRGVPPEAIRDFVGLLAISKTSDNLVEQAMLDHAVRERLNKTAPRRFGVLRPLKLTIENYPEGEGEWVDALNNPEDPDAGTRQVRFGRELLRRGGRLHGGPAQEILSADAGPGGAACATAISSPAWRR